MVKKLKTRHIVGASIETSVKEFFFANPGKSFQLHGILQALELPKEMESAVKRQLRKLVNSNEITKLKGKRFSVGSLSHVRTGTYRNGNFGSGFVTSERGELYVPPGHSSTALPEDMVRVEILARKTGKLPECRVMEVLKRAEQEFVGVFSVEGKYTFVVPDNDSVRRNIQIQDDGVNGAKPGQRVAVKITWWKNEYSDPFGEVVDIIGFPGEKGVSVLAIARAKGFSLQYPKKVMDEVKAMQKLKGDELAKTRKDFRGEEVFTIDPDDAKDFDDAISFKRLPGGNVKIGVYIADVTAYVTDGSPVDKEAKKRGTSVYLIDKVVHMLPEELSTEYCSLVPDEDRPVFAVEMTCKPDGSILNYEFCEGVICNKRRFTYHEAKDVIDGKINSPNRKTLVQMNEFAQSVRKSRIAKGSLNFFIPEAHFEVDEKGHPVNILVSEVLETHQLVEEFMLLANKAAASHVKLLARKLKAQLPFIFRVHDLPNEEKAVSFFEMARSLGCPKVKSGPGTSLWFQEILDWFDGKPEQVFMQDIALRSMSKAVYDTQNIGHFGLGFTDYTHFTSPIRRYADLVVHRLLKKYLSPEALHDLGGAQKRNESICEHVSGQEQRALEAEREAIKLKQLEFMADKVGDEFGGIVSGVTSFGIFIKLESNLVEGLIHIKELDDDYYLFEAEKYRLVGSHKKKVYKIGDKFPVRVCKVNVDRKHMDFEMVKPPTDQKDNKPLKQQGKPSVRSTSEKKPKKRRVKRYGND